MSCRRLSFVKHTGTRPNITSCCRLGVLTFLFTLLSTKIVQYYPCKSAYYTYTLLLSHPCKNYRGLVIEGPPGLPLATPVVKARIQQTSEIRDGFDERRMADVVSGTDEQRPLYAAVLSWITRNTITVTSLSCRHDQHVANNGGRSVRLTCDGRTRLTTVAAKSGKTG